MSETKKTNSFDDILEKKNKPQDMSIIKKGLIDKFQKENEEKEKKLITPDNSGDDIEIVDFVKKNKKDFQEALEVAKTPLQIEETIKAFDPLNNQQIFDKVYQRWVDKPSYPYYATTGSFFTYHIVSFLLGKPKSFGEPDFIYYLPKDRVNAFPEHFKNAGDVVVSKNIQTANKVAEKMAWGSVPQISKELTHSAILPKILASFKGLVPQGTNKLGMSLIVFGVALAFVFSGTSAINQKFKQYQQRSNMVENAKKEIDKFKVLDKQYESDFMSGKITKEQLKSQLENNKNMIDAQQSIVDGK